MVKDKFNKDKDKDNVSIDFVFDNNGDYIYTDSAYGFGKKVNIHGKITTPEDGIYSAEIISSDGGGGRWNNVKANEEIACIINTSILHKTTLKVIIHSNKPNCNGYAVIDYYVG
ncbi:hypothetical protein [Clostridium sp.]|uniref:hypothetical protein n=1 Tax=Clostridium sp. TaxID=1506 RepID=UPI0028414846|nr:hypothetical protein [Clostridium sp.]MDR3594585.1 hypothetical protein [Clostridium sp.]